MPFQLSIQPVIDAQTSALNTTINTARDAVNTNTNAARDNVKADNVTQIGTQTTSITNAVTAARDAVNTNTNTKTGDVTNAVNAKGVIKSVQRGIAMPDPGSNSLIGSVNIAISPVDLSKTQVIVSGMTQGLLTAVAGSARLTSATNLEVTGWRTSSAYLTNVYWQVIEFF